LPEGHTIHRLARDQAKDLVGHQLGASSPQGRFAEGAALLDRSTLEATEAHGKHLVHRYDNGQILYVHLGLIGKFRRRKLDTELIGAIRLRLEGPERAWELVGPMRCELIDEDELDTILSKLGPDPLGPKPDVDEFARRLQRRRIPIAAALLDQSVVSGIGNVYRSEICFLCGIDPRRPAKELSDTEMEELWASTVEQLEIGVRLNRIVTVSRDEVDKPLSRLNRTERLYAYKRGGMECRRCGDEIKSDEVGARKVWWCPTCQS